MTERPDPALVFRLLNEIGIIAQLSGTAFERVMPTGLSLPQFVVLNHLVRVGDDRTPLDLARAMQVTKGTMTNTLGHLTRSGAVEIRPDPKDGRSKRVSITPAGRAAREAAISALMPDLDAIGGAMSVKSIEASLEVLVPLRQFLDARRNGSE